MNKPSPQPVKHFSGIGLFYGLVLIVVFALVGCTSGCNDPKEDPQTQIVRPETTLKIFAVDSPEIVTSAARLWFAEGQGDMEFTVVSLEEFAADEFKIPNGYDVVVYPTSLMPDLVYSEQLVEIPKADLEGDVLDRKELLPHQRKKLLYYGSKVWALPLGSPQLMVINNKSDFEALNLAPPRTWSEFEEVATKLQEAGKRISLPLHDEWAAEIFLSRVACSIRAQGKLSTVFDLQTMKPLIETEPFVKALKSLQAVCHSVDCESDPAAVFRELVDGSASMGICWPSKNFLNDEEEDAIEANEDLALIRLPGSPQWYNQTESSWETRDKQLSIQVDVIGGTGRVVSVCKSSRNGRTAMDFACWLGSKSTSGTVSVGSANVSIFRATHLGQPSRWAGPAVSYEAADQFGDIVSEISKSNLVFQFPRIAGQSQYKAVLADAVRKAVEQDVDAKKCLAEVAEEWETITTDYGREEQLKQLRRSLGYLN